MIAREAAIAWQMVLYFYSQRERYVVNTKTWKVYNKEYNQWSTIWTTLTNQIF